MAGRQKTPRPPGQQQSRMQATVSGTGVTGRERCCLSQGCVSGVTEMKPADKSREQPARKQGDPAPQEGLQGGRPRGRSARASWEETAPPSLHQIEN